MKQKFMVLLMALFTFICQAFCLNAQNAIPYLSPKATMIQQVGISKITVEYNRPSIKGRKIWGGLVPYNVVWRTGANYCTKIVFESPAIIGGNKIGAGEYCLFTIPGPDLWAIILSRNIKQWGAFGYTKEEDMLRFNIKPQATEFTETFTIQFSNLKSHSANLDIIWEKVKVSFPIEFDIKEKIIAGIAISIASAPEETYTYIQPVEYYLENNIDLVQALKWINKSISIEENWLNLRLKAKILFAIKNCAEAQIFARKALEKGSQAVGSQFSYTEEMQQIINGCKPRE